MPSTLALQTDSNVALKLLDRGKLQMRFPRRDGFLKAGRSDFKSQDDLVAYLAQSFPAEPHNGETRFSIQRKGKYLRLNKANEAVFTFGDPMLDLITDEHGRLTIGGKRYDLRVAELAEPGARGGGIHNLDLSPRPGELDRVVSQAALGEGRFTLLSAEGSRVAVASRNPSSLYFYDGTAKMRFRAFKTSYVVGWKMGVDIETWNGDFTRAQIQTDYGKLVGGNICAVVKHDSDSDSNDDYVDEYEWGVFSSPPDGLLSLCQATWLGRSCSGYVSKGSCELWV